jgi:hypothetical protein
MNAAHHLRHFGAAVESLRADRWQAWSLHERESDAILLTPCETVEEAVNQALERGCWQSGDILAVQHSHAGTGRHTLWQFQIKRSSKRTWRRSYDGGPPVPVYAMEPKLVCQVALAAPLQPVPRFDAFRDDPAGRDAQLVEVRS